MKRICQFVLPLLLLCHISTAQNCPLPNGDFEAWTDLTSDFEYYDDLPDGTVVLPEGYIGFLRIFFSSLDELFEVLTGEDLIDFTENYFGIQQTTDASSGDYAVQIGGDEFAPFADLIGVFECDGDLPGSAIFDLKHYGPCEDTISVIGIFNSTPDLPQDESDLNSVRAYFQFTEFTSSTDTEYQTIGLPIIDNDNGIAADSILVFILASGNQECLMEGNESGFRIDNFGFSPSEVLSMGISNASAEFISDHNAIRWTSYQNDNISHFIIERSLGEPNNFIAIGEVENKGLESNYEYIDFGILEANAYYYRVSSIDEQGNKLYSNVVKVDVEYDQASRLRLFPNPVEDHLQLELIVPTEEENLSYQIYSFDGRLYVNEKKINLVMNNGVQLLDVNVEDLIPGNYTIQVRLSNGNSMLQRFVKH